jgi:hypothetical protein
MNLIVLQVTLRTYDHTVTLHPDRADAFARLRLGFPQYADRDDDQLIQAVTEDGHLVQLDEAEVPETKETTTL